MPKNKIIALDIGATNIKVALFTKDTSVYPKLKSNIQIVKTNAISKEAIILSIDETINIFLDNDVEGIAISSAGTINSSKGSIEYATLNLPGMTNFNYKEYIMSKYNLKVEVINDCQGALLGEIYYGPHQFYPNDKIVMLTLGSGVGGAYFKNGKLSCNKKNDDARFGHLIIHPNTITCTCGKVGCVEAFLSGRAINKRALMLSIKENDLFNNFLKGSEPENKLIREIRGDLVLTLEKIYELAPFDECIIGGGVVDWMDKAFYKIIMGLPYTIKKAELGNNAGVYGAIINYIKKSDV